MQKGLVVGRCFAIVSTIAAASFAATQPTHASPVAFTTGKQGSMSGYYVVPLRTLGGAEAFPSAINGRNWVSGLSYLRGNSVEHAVVWNIGSKIDLGTLGGPNSGVEWNDHSNRGEIAGQSETADIDPYAENFCGFSTMQICQGFIWKSGVMNGLPTLGGNNSIGTDVNNAGQTVGYAETATQNPNCAAPQIYDYYGVIWQPNGSVVTLPPYSGDDVSYATAINRDGAVVGASGVCGTITSHPLLWQGGSTIDLGSLGGSSGSANDINIDGEAGGWSNLPGDMAYHAFIWKSGVMTDLGVLPGDVNSIVSSINDKGQVVGFSCDTNGSCHGFLWENGAMIDLNSLIASSGRYLYSAGNINNKGEITCELYDAKANRYMAGLLIPGGKNVPALSGASTPRARKLGISRTLQRRQLPGLLLHPGASAFRQATTTWSIQSYAVSR